MPSFDFYYGRESTQFAFYMIPQALFEDDTFKELSDSAKILYSLMLNRMYLSMKNNWVDEQGRVYIMFSFNNIMQKLNCASAKASKLIKELEDFGLIEKETKIGHPSIIYVKNFISDTSADAKMFENQSTSKSEEVADTDMYENQTTLKSEEVRKSKRFDIQRTTASESEEVPLSEPKTNNTQDDTESSSNNLIHLSVVKPTEMDAMDEAEQYMAIIKENIAYDVMMSDRKWVDRERYDELYELICDVVCVPRKTIRIGGEDYPYSLVKSKFLKLNSSHLQYVLECCSKNTTKVSNIKAYLITALYNAPNTIGSYYTAEVQHDMYGVGEA